MKNFEKLYPTTLMKDGRTNGKYKKLYKKLMTKKEIKTVDKIFKFMDYACDDFIMHDMKDKRLIKLADKFTLIEKSMRDEQWEIADFISKTLTQHQEDFYPDYILDEIDNFGTKKYFKKYGKEYKEKYLKYQILLTIDVMFSEAIGCLYYEIETNRVGLKPRLTLDEHMFGKNKDEDEKLDNSMELDPVYKKVNTSDSKEEATYGQNNFNSEFTDDKKKED